MYLLTIHTVSFVVSCDRDGFYENNRRCKFFKLAILLCGEWRTDSNVVFIYCQYAFHVISCSWCDVALPWRKLHSVPNHEIRIPSSSQDFSRGPPIVFTVSSAAVEPTFHTLYSVLILPTLWYSSKSTHKQNSYTRILFTRKTHRQWTKFASHT